LARGKSSAGILLYRGNQSTLEVLLVHPGGPFWARKDEGAWTIPKGEYGDDETPLTAALREFTEETGVPLKGEPIDLGDVRQAAGKRVHGFAMQGDCDPSQLTSNTFEMEWPPRSGRRQSFPEVDRAAWFSASEARRKMNVAQAEFVDRLQRRLSE
jgi:predicted NUDIX family NTP pyrophosphohydrolase